LAKLLVDNETVKNDLIEAMFVMRNEEE